MVSRLFRFFFTSTLAIALFFICVNMTEAPATAQRATLLWQNPIHRMPASLFLDQGEPVEITWKMLADVQFKDVYVTELDAYYWKPSFGTTVKALEGKEVYITGYVIPVDYDASFYVVSRYPYANCFFCGGGGPESVVDIRFKGKPKAYKTDEHLTFKGRLKLNANDVYSMNYILENATEYKP